MAVTMVVPLILERLKDHLITELITNVSDVNEKVSTVEVGRFQDDPTAKPRYVAVQGGVLNKPDTLDGVVTLEEMHRTGIYVPAREAGGSGQQHWWRRGSCEIGVYTLGTLLTEKAARTAAYNIFGRLTANIENVGVSDLEDSFGESAYKLFVYASVFHQGGGPDKNFIWRGRVLWQALTERTQ